MRQLDYLKSMRFNSPSGEVNEDVIVRDLLFVFQGIQGQFITYSLLEDAYILQPNLTFSPSTRKLINELCELGWLFKKVNDWLLRNNETSVHCNQVTQSLCFAI
jgi:gamma-tubulin complex component 3